MTQRCARKAHLQDTIDLYSAISAGTLPAVSYVKPSGLVDGHPASSKLELFEGFVKKIVDAVQANPTLAKDTAIFITFDEGGGYWDSGYVQPLDFFGDGTRIPHDRGLAVPARAAISLTATRTTSRPRSSSSATGACRRSPTRSRDNLPNPVVSNNPYVPVNAPGARRPAGTCSTSKPEGPGLEV